MKLKRRYVVGAVLILVVVGVLSLKGKPAPQADAAKVSTQQSVLSVHTVVPQTLAWPQTLTASGQIAPWQEASISSETSGLAIVELTADVGDNVKRGQALAVLSQESVKADLQKAQAGVAEAQANLAKAQSEAKRAESLKESGALSNQQITQYHIAAQTAKAQLDSAKAAQESARINLARTSIRAVDDGVITVRSATLGTVVSAGSEMFKMLRQGKLEWQAELDSAQISQVVIGQKVNVTLPGGRSIIGSVRAVSPALDVKTSRGIVYISLDSASQAVAGSFASGTVELAQKDALTVPLSALVMRDGNAYLFVVSDDQRAVRNQVTTGRRKGDRVEILSGMDAKANVVESGGAFLSDGSPVTVLKE